MLNSLTNQGDTLLNAAYDVAIIGGGINGCGCAADAALRGLSTLLCEQDDIAAKTSSCSSKLIHGGLRYLENYEFSLVKKSLDERQKLLQLAPHLVQPLCFVLPLHKAMRPTWILRIGLFLYDHLSRDNSLPHCQSVKRHSEPNYFAPLASAISKGFLYYDCKTDDARLTLANALQAKLHGATILTRTKLIHAAVVNKVWELTFQRDHQPPFILRAKAVINAAGPWSTAVSQLLQTNANYALSLVKGSHVLVKPLYQGDYAYLLQQDDKRIIFTIPYHGYTLIGTTEQLLQTPSTNPVIDAEEIDYLFTITNQYFNKQLHAHDIIHSWSGIRPLLASQDKSARQLSRDYELAYANQPAPTITILGGKITTYRQLALKAIDELRPIFPNLAPSKTDTTPLPGATLGAISYHDYHYLVQKKYSWLDQNIRNRLLNTYGTRMEKIVGQCQTTHDLGQRFASTLYQREVDYLIKEEWAQNSEDILWRRTQLGLYLNNAEKQHLQSYLQSQFNDISYIR